MKVFFAFILLYYFFGVQYGLQVWLGGDMQMIGWINTIVITCIALLYYHCKTHDVSWKMLANALQSIYKWFRKIAEKYLFVLLLVLVVLMAAANVFWPIDILYTGWIIALWIISFFLVWDAFWDAKIYFGRHLFLHKESIFWISVALTFLTVHWARGYGIWAPMIAIVIGTIVYITVMKMTRVVHGYNLWKLFPTRAYTFALIVAGGYIFGQYYQPLVDATVQQLRSDAQMVIQSYRDRTQQAMETLAITQSNDIDTIITQEQTTDIIIIEDQEEISETIEDIITTGQVQESILPDVDMQAQVTFTQALEHIFATYEVPLSTAGNVRFANIPSTDQRYALFKTAHERSLLGAKIDPDAFVRCDVYMVMKGIVAGRSIGNQSNVFDKYRAAATANDQINGCERNAFVKVENL